MQMETLVSFCNHLIAIIVISSAVPPFTGIGSVFLPLRVIGTGRRTGNRGNPTYPRW